MYQETLKSVNYTPINNRALARFSQLRRAYPPQNKYQARSTRDPDPAAGNVRAQHHPYPPPPEVRRETGSNPLQPTASALGGGGRSLCKATIESRCRANSCSESTAKQPAMYDIESRMNVHMVHLRCFLNDYQTIITRRRLQKALSSEYGAFGTVKARCWHWLSGKSP